MQHSKIKQGDCLELMKDIPEGSIDMILCDLPYGTTQCKWDIVIPFEPLWAQYKRIIKDNGAIVLFGSEPFSSELRMSNLKMYKHDWIWEKTKACGFLNAHRMPLKAYENIMIFAKKATVYNPIFTYGHTPYKKVCVSNGTTSVYGDFRRIGHTEQSIDGRRFPRNVIKFSNPNNKSVHPTQKPVPLLEYLIKTYTNEGDTVLDNCMGSGSTGVACINTGRNFIGIELDNTYFDIAKKRINEATMQNEVVTV